MASGESDTTYLATPKSNIQTSDHANHILRMDDTRIPEVIFKGRTEDHWENRESAGQILLTKTVLHYLDFENGGRNR